MDGSLLSERGVSPVKPESKQIRGRTNSQTDRPYEQRTINQRPGISRLESTDHVTARLYPRRPVLAYTTACGRSSILQIPHADPITKPYKPAPKPTATAAKPHDTWKAELNQLMAGMALPAQQQRKAILSKQAPSKHPPFNLPTL